MPAVENFRENLRRFCRRRKITQTDLAEKAGVHWVTLSRILNGSLSPSVETCEKLADAAGKPLQKFFSEPRGK